MEIRYFKRDLELCSKEDVASASETRKALSYWLKRAQLAEAQLVAMREALEMANTMLILYCDPFKDKLAEKIMDKIEKSLSSDITKEILGRIEDAERILAFMDRFETEAQELKRKREMNNKKGTVIDGYSKQS